MGESLEVRSLRRYLVDSAVSHKVTATTNHAQTTATGNTSRHVMAGTDGMGLALDAAGKSGGRDTSELLAIRYAFKPVEHLCYELIYYGLGAPPSIKRGKPYIYPKVVQDGHHNHVHVAVAKGVLLHWTPVPPKEHPVALNMPACAVKLTESGNGYWIVAQDGGIFHFGDATDLSAGSLASTHLNKPIVGFDVAKDGHGFVMVAADGGVFTHNLAFHGSAA